MKHHLPQLDSLKAFESAARHLSFSIAAEELCLTKGAISYQIRKLEETIDCALFKRSTRQVYLTDAGQILLQTTSRLFDELEQTFEQLAPTESDPDILIAATTYVASRWLSPRIARFTEQYPDVSIVFQHSVNSEDFKLQDVDIAIRWCKIGVGTDRSRLLELPMSLYPACSPNLLHRLDVDNLLKPLSNYQIGQAPFDTIPLLCEDRRLDLWQEWYGGQNGLLPNPRRIIADSNVRTQAAIDGQGWTLADAMMSNELESGALVTPFMHQLEGYGYALFTSPGRYLNHKAKGLRDWLVREAL